MNGNGFLSLAEVDLGLKTMLVSALGTQKGGKIWKRFRRCYIRAFADAADAAPDHHRLRASSHTRLSDDDFVSRREFRLLFVYLRIYATWYEVRGRRLCVRASAVDAAVTNERVLRACARHHSDIMAVSVANRLPISTALALHIRQSKLANSLRLSARDVSYAAALRVAGRRFGGNHSGRR